VVDLVECRSQIGVKHPQTPRIFTPGDVEDSLDRIMAPAPRPKSVGLRLKACLPLGFQRVTHPILLDAISDNRDGDFILPLLW